jgi:hypothetical protein
VTAEKVEIVKQNAESYGLNVTLDAIGLPKSTWYYWKNKKVNYEEKYGYLHEPLIEVLNDNPAYGYRWVEPELKARGYRVGRPSCSGCLGCGICRCDGGRGSPSPPCQGSYWQRAAMG